MEAIWKQASKIRDQVARQQQVLPSFLLSDQASLIFGLYIVYLSRICSSVIEISSFHSDRWKNESLLLWVIVTHWTLDL
jgi:hypothetical protein